MYLVFDEKCQDHDLLERSMVNALDEDTIITISTDDLLRDEEFDFNFIENLKDDLQNPKTIKLAKTLIKQIQEL